MTTFYTLINQATSALCFIRLNRKHGRNRTRPCLLINEKNRESINVAVNSKVYHLNPYSALFTFTLVA